ncbi:MAG: DUF805 domain-containing protein [Hyphomonas sp.]
MRGEVLKPDDAAGTGLILGEDGKRYHFTTARVHKGAALAAGAPVDFIGLGEDARDIYPLASPRSPPPNINTDAAYTPAVAAKSEGMFRYFVRALSKNYFQFYGRARRAEYWGFILFCILTLIGLFIVDAMISTAFLGVDTYGGSNFFPLLTGLFYLYSIIPGIAVTIRRLHDQDMSGWLYLLNVVPYIGGIILFILMFFDSRPNPNKHGPSPKYGAAQTVDVFA